MLFRSKDGVDYVMPKELKSTWISVKGFSVYIRPTDEGVVVDIYKKGTEDDDAIAGAYAFDQELTEEKDT